MRRCVTILLMLLVVAWSVPATAITAKSNDKDAKPTASKPAEQPSQPAPQTDKAKASEGTSQPSGESKSTLLNRLKREVTESKSKPQKYDNFQDRNKDGVSDDVRKRPATETVPASAAPAAKEPAKPKAEPKKTTDSSEKKKPDRRK